MLPFAIEHQIDGHVSRLRAEAEQVRSRRQGRAGMLLAAVLRALADRLEPTVPGGVIARPGT